MLVNSYDVHKYILNNTYSGNLPSTLQIYSFWICPEDISRSIFWARLEFLAINMSPEVGKSSLLQANIMKKKMSIYITKYIYSQLTKKSGYIQFLL